VVNAPILLNSSSAGGQLEHPSAEWVYDEEADCAAERDVAEVPTVEAAFHFGKHRLSIRRRESDRVDLMLEVGIAAIELNASRRDASIDFLVVAVEHDDVRTRWLRREPNFLTDTVYDGRACSAHQDGQHSGQKSSPSHHSSVAVGNKHR